MASPSTSLATLRPELAATFMEFDLEADRMGFIGPRVMPVVEVDQAAGTFGKLTVEELLRSGPTDRAPGSGYNRDTHRFTTDSFSTKEHGAEEVVDDNQARMYRLFFDAEMVAAARARDRVLRNAEIRVATAMFNSTTFNTTAVTNEWDDLANATPITDVEAAVQRVYDATGIWPNTLIVNRKVFRNLRNCTQIIDRIKYSGRDDPKADAITASMLAEVFGLQNMLVAGSSQNTADEGQAASMSPIWSDEYALVCRTSDSADFADPCVGRTFHWADDGSQILGTVESYRDETSRGDVIRVRHQTHEKDLYSELGELLENITT